MRALRSVANADDEGIANEDRRLTIADLPVSEMGWARDDEQLVAIDVEALAAGVRGARPRSPAGASR